MTKTIVMEFFVLICPLCGQANERIVFVEGFFDVVFHLGVNIYSSRQHDSIVIATTMTYKAGY
ncbi:hypothetical protein ECIG_02101 [Escherichia coli M605]|uniref:Uncharacterized protein n=1 Tax=Escherichia coli M605 TaxID=656417 RepID=F4T121_ECOLX|nr:hypothetical protein [Escherichia coli]EGI15466.1 hypothetical protein ECIG_02101 [Escherichia coli M605]